MNNTLTNGLKVLEFLAATGQTHSVKELAGIFKLPNSHICRLLKTLCEGNYIEQDKNRKYKISLKVLNLSNACLAGLGMRSRLRPFIDRLSKETQQTVFLSIPWQNNPIIIDVVYSHTNADPALCIGSINPLHCSASGKVCAAYLPAETLNRVLEGVEFKKITEKTITDPVEFKKELENIRGSKIATAIGERGPGVNALGAPVFDCNGMLAGIIGVNINKTTLDDAEWAFFKGKISEMAEAASYAMGFAAYANA